MKAILNRKIIDLDQLTLYPGNRGFKYGDGLFETIAMPKGEPRLLDLHLGRLKEGAAYLELNVEKIIQQDQILDDIRQLQKLNNIAKDGIVRLSIWRNTEGKYTPVGGTTDSLLTIEKSAFDKVNIKSKANFSEKTVNYPSDFSRFKTMSALKYVVAGIEKKERNLDEIIILDHNGHISEALSSNIFWKKQNVYYTPPLSTGCISGVMRQWITKALKENGLLIEEKLIEKHEFLQSDCIFTSNAIGIGHIKTIEQFSFEIDHVSQDIIERIS